MSILSVVVYKDVTYISYCFFLRKFRSNKTTEVVAGKLIDNTKSKHEMYYEGQFQKLEIFIVAVQTKHRYKRRNDSLNKITVDKYIIKILTNLAQPEMTLRC